MNTQTTSRWRRPVTEASLLAAAACAIALATAACGASSTSTGTSHSSGAASNPAGVSYAAAQVAEYEKPAPAFKNPGPALRGVAKLRGKTVWLVPANYGVQYFHLYADALKEALTKVGVKLEVCDGASSPSATSSCLNQAVDAKAAGVIMASIPAAFVPTAAANVTKHNIPLLYASVSATGPGNPKDVGYISQPSTLLEALNADWVIDNSKGKAHVLVVEITDNPATIAWMRAGAVAQFKTHCPACTVHVLALQTADLSKLPGDVSTALANDSDIRYVLSEFDVEVPAIIQGLQTVSGGAQVKVGSETALLAEMQQLKAGRFIGSETGFSINRLGWASTDQMLRMMTGAPALQNVAFPVRMFTATNISSLTLSTNPLTQEGWYGPLDYKSAYEKLWGLQ